MSAAFASSAHIEPLVDAYTPVHAIIGFAAGVMGVDPHLAMMAFIGARIVEQALEAGPAHALLAREEGHSLGNEMTDLGFEIVGLHLGEKLREHLLDSEPAALESDPVPTPAAGLGRYAFHPLLSRHLHGAYR